MATLKEISLLQKRARDKEYKLRRNGGKQEAIREISPRKDWQEVKNMTARQRTAYAKKLEKFNARDNKLLALESGEILDYTVIRQIKNNLKDHNKRVEKFKKKLFKTATEEQKAFFREKEKGGTQIDSIAFLRERHIKVMPKSLKTAKKMLESSKRLAKKNFEKNITNQRLNMIEMLNKVGRTDLANIVRTMRTDKFKKLTFFTDVWENVKILYELFKLGYAKHAAMIDQLSQTIVNQIYNAQASDKEGKDKQQQILKTMRKQAKKTNQEKAREHQKVVERWRAKNETNKR